MSTITRVSSILLLLTASAVAQEPDQRVVFRDVARAAGVDFLHTNGRAGHLYVIEVKGSGIALVDYDGDGDLDLYAVNGNNLPGASTDIAPINHLYRNNGDGTFSDVTAQAGVGDGGYGHGVAAADYDNDGDQDLYVLNYGPNVLYRNNGDGTFSDVTTAAGVGGNVWSVSAAFCDFDNDGLLDLYVANYLVFDINSTVRLPNGPGFYDGEVDVLYLNNGDGTFRDVTRQNIGNPNGKGLGVLCFDYDDDGDQEIYVANDGTVNLMYENQGGAVFRDVTLLSGTGVNGAGATEAGMGVDAGDYDNDGDMDVFVTNYKGETNTLYRNDGRGIFTDATSPANLAAPSMPYVTFGTGFVDFDNDGDLDIYVANGHTEEDLPDHAQPDQLFENLGNGVYRDVSEVSGAPFRERRVGRGVAFGDFDNDGDIDIVVSNKNAPLFVLQNQGGNRNNWLSIRTRGTISNRDGIGARITVSAEGFERSKDVRTSYSMFSASDLRVHFGLGKRERVNVNVRWPSGRTDTFADVPANRLVLIEEGGKLSERSLRPIETSYVDEVPASVAAVDAGEHPLPLEESVRELRAVLDGQRQAQAEGYLRLGKDFRLWINAQTRQYFAQLLAEQPQREDLLVEFGAFLHFIQDFEGAIRAFHEAAQHSAEPDRLYSRVAALHLRMGRFEQAVEFSRIAMAQGDSSEGTQLRLAQALAGLGRSQEAEAILRELLRRHPRSAPAHVQLGKVLVEAGEVERGLEHYRTAIRLEPGARESHYQLADAYRRLGRDAEYQREMAIYTLLEADSAMFRGGMSPAAEAALLHREIRMNPLFGRTRADRQLARRYDQLGDDANENLYSVRARASELKDELADELNALRRTLEFDPNEQRRAMFAPLNELRLRFVAALNAACAYDARASARLAEQARGAAAARRYDAALAAFHEALLADPDNADALRGLVELYLSTGFRVDYARGLAHRAVLADQSAASYRVLAEVYTATGQKQAAARFAAMARL